MKMQIKEHKVSNIANALIDFSNPKYCVILMLKRDEIPDKIATIPII
jgi:hypothetical protein